MKPYVYRGFGMRIESELELPELPPEPVGVSGEPDLAIRLGHIPRSRRKATLDDELAFNAVGAAFRIRGGREITVDPRSDADPGAVRVVLLGRVMAFLFRQRGWLPLHSSGVMVNEHCVLFLGSAGAGKSTTAAAFHRKGHLVITDDVGPVRVVSGGQCVVQPAWSYVRLCEDARPVLGTPGAAPVFQADKHRFDLNRDVAEALYVVGCVYVVEYGDILRAEPVPALEAAVLLGTHSFVKHHETEKDALDLHLRNCADVAAVLPVRRLIRPKSLGGLEEIVRFVEADLRCNVPVPVPLPDSGSAAGNRR